MEKTILSNDRITSMVSRFFQTQEEKNEYFRIIYADQTTVAQAHQFGDVESETRRHLLQESPENQLFLDALFVSKTFFVHEPVLQEDLCTLYRTRDALRAVHQAITTLPGRYLLGLLFLKARYRKRWVKFFAQFVRENVPRILVFLNTILETK